ncbi:hypothetical protein [Ramlibacter albus]|uniref:Uncharacterized protein n=1 Tax=Ramlibacter albus TaxID=2079448 RepID=A0A923MFW0_9BURK|nr:hypothetical protein [Ramlibacter albus]MBC5768699.1 hypothetical protein [Ramlibacter albus]
MAAARRRFEWPLQAALYTAFMALVALLSTAPAWQALPPGTAVVTVTLLHHGQRVEPCRPYTAEELARLPPNMRAPQKCGRERVPVLVELDIDGVNVMRESAPPAGLSRDGASSLYRRVQLTAGEHRLTVRMKDAPGDPFNHTREATVKLAPAQVLVIDFDNAKGITLS